MKHLSGGSHRPPPTTPRAEPTDDGRPRPVPGKQAESPLAFYERVTKREDVRRLLTKLAKPYASIHQQR
jgi:hypothetical protein